ncbi:monocarboxylate transporter 12-like isoform X2 [Patiria miniata]|uniref:Major facilitator superfamily (MFS) profile domain-containing protein n=1 Tax=Patiria miniata TaxID=46514 RepID=A0A914BHC9_PATMI|nr:monocarboxylate transporter 12-like isoform X2 [Patiria miniata]
MVNAKNMPSTTRVGCSFGWVVAAIGFSTGAIEPGTFKSFGVFILPIQESLDCSISALGTAIAASHTACYVLVPLVNILTEKYGSRRLVMLGGIIMFLSFLGISLATNIAVFSVFIVIWGMGVSLAYVPPIAAVIKYFPTNAALPISITTTGCAFGMMIYPPLTEALIEIYGWRETILIFAAFNANICVFGALIKPPPPLYEALATPRQEMIPALSLSGDSKLNNVINVFKKAAKGFSKIVSLDVLLLEPIFTIYAFACFVLGIMYSAWMIYLVPHAVVRGIGNQRASLLSTAGGVGNLVGRIVYGPILHRGYIKPVQMFMLLACGNLGAFVLDPIVLDNYPGLVGLSSINGLCLGVMAGMFILVSQQVLEGEIGDRAWGILCVSFAVGELAGGAFAGLLFEATGSYELPFLFLGGLSAFIAAALAVERLWNRFWRN